MAVMSYFYVKIILERGKIMENMLFCQSCGMPLENEDVIGTNNSGSKNEDFCIYCYKDGNYTEDVTMNEMIDISLKHMKEMFKDNLDFNDDEALNKMKYFFPKLKRWKCTCVDECANGYNPNCNCTSTECHCREEKSNN